MDKEKARDLLEERIGGHPALVDYNIREKSEIIDIKMKSSIESIESLPIPNISKIFVDEFDGDYGLVFTEDPPRGIPDQLSGKDEGLYIAVIEEPDDFIGYVYTYGAYFDIPVLNLVEAIEEMGDSATYDEFIQVMSDNYHVENSELEDVVDEQYSGFSISNTDEDGDSAFKW